MYRDVNDEFVHASAGVTVGRICSIIDLGMQYSERYDKTQHQVFIEFEIEEQHDGKPLVIGAFFTTKFSKKSNLYKLIHAAFGKAIPRQAQANFDFTVLLTRPVQLTIESKQGAETEYSKIVDYAFVRDPQTVPELTRATQYFDMDAPDWTVYHNLTSWMKDRIEVPEKLRQYCQPANYPENRDQPQQPEQPPAPAHHEPTQDIQPDSTIPF